MGKKWTDKELEELKEVYLVLSNRALAYKYKTTEKGIRLIRKKLGLHLTPRIIKERKTKAAYASHEKRNSKKRNPFPGASIYVVTYFAHIKKQKGLKAKLYGASHFQELLQDIADSLNLLPDDITGDGKKNIIVTARQIFCYVATIICPNKTYNDIAQFLGYSSHSMIVTSLRKVRHYFKIEDSKFMNAWYQYRANTKVYIKTKYTDHAN